MPDGFPKRFHPTTDEIYSICFSAGVHVRAPRSEFSGMVGSPVVSSMGDTNPQKHQRVSKPTLLV
jgi:hypothetical protein